VARVAADADVETNLVSWGQCYDLIKRFRRKKWRKKMAEIFGLMVRGLSHRPNLTEGPSATWDFRRSTKEEEEEEEGRKWRVLTENTAKI
jgi:hypothetical protein